MASSGSAAGASIDLSGVFSPLYWGFVFSLLLGGITLLQGYIYFTRSNDKLSIRLAAGSMIIFDMLSSALIAQSVYYYLIPYFGSLVPLSSITPELSAECLVSTIITFLSQMCFARQLYSVTSPAQAPWSDPTMLITLVIVFFALCAFGFGVACTIVMVIHDHSVLANRADTFQIFFGLAKGFGALTDIIATIAMCTVLVSVRGSISRTNSLINTIIQFVIHRGALVTLIQTMLLIMFFAERKQLYWLAFHVNVTKLYANTFFAMLNGRERMNQRSVDPSVSLSDHSSRHAHIEAGNHSVVIKSRLESVHDSSFVQSYETAPRMNKPDADTYAMYPMSPVN